MEEGDQDSHCCDSEPPPPLHYTLPQSEMGPGAEGSPGHVQSQKQWKAGEDSRGLRAERRVLVVLLSETGNGRSRPQGNSHGQ